MALKTDFSWSEVGARIRDMRKQLDMSQQALGAAAKITQNGVFRLEAGATNPQLTTLQNIAAALGCSVRYLVSGTPDRDSVFADRYLRIQRIVESRDDMAIRAMDGGIESAEELLERGGRSRPEKRSLQRGAYRPGTHVIPFEDFE
jgi:transcriptional regulator with XRE-family HTH domain